MGTDNFHHKRKRSSRDFKRKEQIRDKKETFLIVCEGEKTEPNYFDAFKVKTAEIKIRGLGENTISLVQSTIKLMEKGDYDQVWCVFDRDSFKKGNFYTAIKMAQNNGIKVAYSNEAFELWYVLHFQYLQSAIPREQYNKMLDGLLKRKYKKEDKTMYHLLLDKQQFAINNARALLGKYPVGSNPENNKPSTTVHLLVEELNKFK